ncbi:MULTISPECIES: TnsA endonuclease N-terminal domain-containing protein [Marinobacter]|uniref:TnsA endonuclease N-terminal domain-containing protein n=1 Tax=Marinobacter TaxID=2742 RepID=UPI000C8C5285|nr:MULTISPECIES: TnsA endonuclease N-terminal domain-containing protein [unclassified Marinobacter]MAC21832.1 heteromeric transposase endonuclease subunit TnsA [Marinobacter sp.]HCL38545.1 heteromeric transposase endonuclease subunit TnsA [Marinobacter nauticus]|tara:strand:+ start:753 stop:1574 length:822 start_codon:yes stop_codon:yes gene_type:complete
MANYKIDKKTEKWIKEERGKGRGKDYQPWLTVRDLPSSGRSHRVMGHLTGRTHHFLSDTELAAFLLLEWNPDVIDIREQFPLRIEDTLSLAEQAKISHPAVSGYHQIMSSDFLVDLSSSTGPQSMAIQVKVSSDLMDPRTVEILEIERRYWKLKGIPWYLITEKQMPATIMANLDLLYSARVQSESLEVLFQSLPIYVSALADNPNTRLPEIGMLIDHSYSLEPGTSLARLRALVALRALTFDISIPWNKLVSQDLQVVEDIALLRASYAANQ